MWAHPDSTTDESRRRRRRRLLAALGAFAVHGFVFVAIHQRSAAERPRTDAPAITWASPDTPRHPVTLEVRVVPPATPEVAVNVEPVTTPASTTTTPASTTPTTTTTTTTTPATTATTTATSSSTGTTVADISDDNHPAPTDGRAGDVRDVDDYAPLAENLPTSLGRIIRGVDGRGPRQSLAGLADALDYVPDEAEDFGKSGATLAAARAERRLRQSIAFHDVTVGMASDWFRELKNGAEKAFRPTPGDLDNPGDVTRTTILANFLKDPAAWDDEAKRVLGPLLAASALHSQDPIKRLALGNSAALGTSADSSLRATTVEDLLRRKEAGLSVRFAFEVDVHHDSEGHVTAIDILRTQFEKQLQEKIRLAIEEAVRAAAPAPTLASGGRPFRSRWLFAATWFIDPPGCLAMPSDAMGAVPGVAQASCGGTFDIGADGSVKTSSFDVQQKVTAELLRVTPLGR